MDVVQIGCIKQVFNRFGKVNIMENTIENKAKFFAQYWGQKVGKTEYESQLWINECFLNSISFLQLKPLSSITNEDAIEVANLLGNCSHLSDEGKIFQVKDLLSNPNFYVKQTNISANQWLKVFDFLRSKSYALPYMGLSVETMIEYGWIKLTQ